MKKILLFPLVALFVLFGSFSITGIVQAAYISFTWNEPYVFSSPPAGIDSPSVTWVPMNVNDPDGTMQVVSGQKIPFSVTADIPPEQRRVGIAILKMHYPTEAWTADFNPDNPPVDPHYPDEVLISVAPPFIFVQLYNWTNSYRVINITSQDVTNGYVTLSGEITAADCGNSSPFTAFDLSIESIGPYSTASCPDGSAIRDGVCVSPVIPTPVFYSTNDCPPGSFIRDGVCIISTITTPVFYSTADCPVDSAILDGVCVSTFLSPNIFYSTANCPACSVIRDGICIIVASCVPPSASNLQLTTVNYCTGTLGLGSLSFQWTYTDTDNDAEKRFDFQIDNNSNFGSPEVDRRDCDVGLTNPNSPRTNEQTVTVIPSPAPFIQTYCAGTADQYPVNTPDALSYNSTYYWRVKVYSASSDSGWVTGSSFTTASHYYPYSNFTISPSSAGIGQSVTFTSTSQCSSACINTWTFGDGTPTEVEDVVIHPYDTAGTYSVGLSTSDGSFVCTSEGTVRVGVTGIPEWHEIAPF